MKGPLATSSKGVTIHSLTIEHEVYYAVQEPHEERAQPPALLIAAHGYGQSCKSFIKNFSLMREQPLLVAVPQGPNQFYWQQNPPKVGFTWVTGFGRDQALHNLMTYLDRFVTDLGQKYPFDPQRVFLMGFSNGAAQMFRLAASDILSPRGVIACCGDLPENVAQRLNEIQPFPVLIMHGKNDEMVTMDKAKEAEEILTRHGYDVTTDYFDGGHELPSEKIPTIIEWINSNSEA